MSTNQIEFSPLALEPLADGTLDQCVDLGIRPMAWSPLGGGRLFAEGDARGVRVRAALGAIGAAHGVSAATAAYAWILRHPSRPVPITGSRRVEAVEEAVAVEVAEEESPLPRQRRLRRRMLHPPRQRQRPPHPQREWPRVHEVYPCIVIFLLYSP